MAHRGFITKPRGTTTRLTGTAMSKSRRAAVAVARALPTIYLPAMHVARVSAGILVVLTIATLDAQTAKPKPPASKAPAAAPLTKIQAELQCPSELGVGAKTKRRFCDVLSGRDPKGGILITIPSHRGPLTLTFDLHNRHTYSEELIKAKTAFREYTATIGVLTMDNTLINRAIIQSDFRTAADLFDRIEGGAGPGGFKAVAPAGNETITMELPGDVGDQVSILGENLKIKRPDGDDNFTAPGRPIASISNVMLEYRPAPPKPAPKPAPSKVPPKKP